MKKPKKDKRKPAKKPRRKPDLAAKAADLKDFLKKAIGGHD